MRLVEVTKVAEIAEITQLTRSGKLKVSGWAGMVEGWEVVIAYSFCAPEKR